MGTRTQDAQGFEREDAMSEIPHTPGQLRPHAPIPPATPGDFAPAGADPHSNDEFGGPPGHGHVGHIVSMQVLLSVFGALVVLTGVTVGVSYVNFGEMNLVVALAIAVVKASLVVLYFMHLRWDKPFNSIVFIGCLIFVALFISLSMLDSGQYHKSVLNEESPDLNHKTLIKASETPGAVAVPGVAPAPEEKKLNTQAGPGI